MLFMDGHLAREAFIGDESIGLWCRHNSLIQGVPLCINGILLPKLFWPTARKNCSSDREKLLKFKAEEGQEFAKFMRSLDAKWNKDLGCRNLQEQVRKYSKKNLKPYLKYLTDYYPRKQSSTNLSFILYDGPEIFFVTLHGLKKWPTINLVSFGKFKGTLIYKQETGVMHLSFHDINLHI